MKKKYYWALVDYFPGYKPEEIGYMAGGASHLAIDKTRKEIRKIYDGFPWDKYCKIKKVKIIII